MKPYSRNPQTISKFAFFSHVTFQIQAVIGRHFRDNFTSGIVETTDSCMMMGFHTS